MLVSMTGLSDEVLDSTFMKGLKPDIRAEVRVFKPNRQGSLMETTQLIEEKK